MAETDEYVDFYAVLGFKSESISPASRPTIKVKYIMSLN